MCTVGSVVEDCHSMAKAERNFPLDTWTWCSQSQHYKHIRGRPRGADRKSETLATPTPVQSEAEKMCQMGKSMGTERKTIDFLWVALRHPVKFRNFVTFDTSKRSPKNLTSFPEIIIASKLSFTHCSIDKAVHTQEPCLFVCTFLQRQLSV